MPTVPVAIDSYKVVGFDPSTKEGALTFAKNMLESVRGQYEEDYRYPPVTFLLTDKPAALRGEDTTTPGTLVLIPQRGLDRNTYEHTLRTLVRKVQAYGAMFIAESWSLDTKQSPAELKAFFSKHELREHPDATEIMFLTFEHKALESVKIWRAPITRERNNPHPELGPFEELEPSTIPEGRFTRLLQSFDGDPSYS